MYDVVGSRAKQGSNVHFRSDGVNVSHKGPIIREGSGGLAYHLRTDVSMKLKHWTNLKNEQSSESEEPVQKINGLGAVSDITKAAPDWY